MYDVLTSLWYMVRFFEINLPPPPATKAKIFREHSWDISQTTGLEVQLHSMLAEVSKYKPVGPWPQIYKVA